MTISDTLMLLLFWSALQIAAYGLITFLASLRIDLKRKGE